jgi:TolB protein
MQRSTLWPAGARSTRRLPGLTMLMTLLTATAVLLAVVAPAAEAAFPGRNGRIAYEQYLPSSNTFELRTMKADGSSVKTVAKNAFEPALSPNGKKIAYVKAVKGAPQIFTMNADGANKKQLTDFTNGADEPAWSPNGKRIVYVRYGASASTIWHMSASTGGDRQRVVGTTDPQGRQWYPGAPAWSPNGKRIAFVGMPNGPGTGVVYTITPTGSGLTRLTPLKAFAGLPEWSPDGARIAYAVTSPERGTSAIHTMKPDGSSKVKVVDVRYGYGHAWSPDGKRIVFSRSSTDGASHTLHTVRPNGTGLTLVKKGFIFAPSWQPLP